MPFLNKNDRTVPNWQKNHYLQTIVPYYFRAVGKVIYKRERISTPDDDFLDLDWSTVGSTRLGIVIHGLEGDSSVQHIKGFISAFNQNKIDGLALNLRGCSGEPNLKPFAYHAGVTNDLRTVVEHAIHKKYEEIYLIGVSLGGNICLKYMGEHPATIPTQIKKAVAFSVPIHLSSSCDEIVKPHNSLYHHRFMRSMKANIRKKAKSFPEVDTRFLKKVKTIKDIDDGFTAPMFGFKDAEDYYAQNSSINFIANIQRPTLLVNAQNDTFLSNLCYPVSLARDNPCFYFEQPQTGGHVGFGKTMKNGMKWAEWRAMEFLLKDV